MAIIDERILCDAECGSIKFATVKILNLCFEHAAIDRTTIIFDLMCHIDRAKINCVPSIDRNEFLTTKAPAFFILLVFARVRQRSICIKI